MVQMSRTPNNAPTVESTAEQSMEYTHKSCVHLFRAIALIILYIIIPAVAIQL